MTPCCHDNRCWRCAGRGQGTGSAFHCCWCPPAQPSAKGFFSLPCCSHAYPWLRPCSHEHCSGTSLLLLLEQSLCPKMCSAASAKPKLKQSPEMETKGVLENWDKPAASFHPAWQGSDEGAGTACQEQARAELEHVVPWQLLHATDRDRTVNVLSPTAALRVRRWLRGRKMT